MLKELKESQGVKPSLSSYHVFLLFAAWSVLVGIIASFDPIKLLEKENASFQ